MAAVYRFDLVTKQLCEELDAAGATAAHSSLLADTAYVVSGTQIKALVAGAAYDAVWRSRLYAFPFAIGFGWLRINGPMLAPATVRLICDGVLMHTATISTRDPQRVPARLGYHWEVEVESDGRVTSLALAQASMELSA